MLSSKLLRLSFLYERANGAQAEFQPNLTEVIKLRLDLHELSLNNLRQTSYKANLSSYLFLQTLTVDSLFICQTLYAI